VVGETGGSLGVSYVLPAVSTNPPPYTVIKVDSGAGIVTVTTPDGSTINGDSSYLLVDQYQSVTFGLIGGQWYVGANGTTNTFVGQVGGSVGVTYDLPLASSTPPPYTVIKTDSGVGAVTVTTTDSTTINGDSSYLLVNTYQYATFGLISGEWYVLANN
jgi:hypothetical protein